MRRALPALLALLAGCDTGFRTEDLVQNLRVLGINSTPADLRPGETAQLGSLILDPSRPGEVSTVLWLGCEPDPYNLNRSACSDPAVLNDPSQLTAGGALPPGVKVIGFNAQAAYAAPAGLFDALAPDDQRRQIGTAGQVIAFAVAEQVSPAATQEELAALFQRARDGQVRSLLTLYRIHISESPERNSNPVVAAVDVGLERWPDGAAFTVLPGEPVSLDVEVPDDSFETYTDYPPEGPTPRTERLLAAWYVTAGALTHVRTAVREGEVRTIFTAPGNDEKHPVPDRRTGSLYVVLRDTRGGQAWREFHWFVCDPALPAPVVTRVTRPASAAEPFVLQGQDLASVLDVVVNGAALRGGAYSPTKQTWEGFAATLPGPQDPLTVHAKNCTRFGL